MTSLGITPGGEVTIIEHKEPEEVVKPLEAAMRYLASQNLYLWRVDESILSGERKGEHIEGWCFSPGTGSGNTAEMRPTIEEAVAHKLNLLAGQRVGIMHEHQRKAEEAKILHTQAFEHWTALTGGDDD